VHAIDFGREEMQTRERREEKGEELRGEPQFGHFSSQFIRK